MRNVVIYELLSLDGVAERPIEFMTDFDQVIRENLGRVLAEQDAVILGRQTYDEWAEFWPASDHEPFASFINGVQKYVLTSTVPERSWTNTTVVDEDLEALVRELKQQTGGDIGVHGSISVADTLLRRELADELRLVIAPALVGSGRRLFENSSPQRFEVTRNVTSPAGYLLVDLRARR
jgi:dihydrofolate reductase